MSRWEFMRQLEDLLSDISPGEREEALQYYNDYFNDAGRQNEQEVIKALGTPEQVAQIVKDGISGNGDAGEFTETGFTSAAPSGRNELIKGTAQSGGTDNGSGTESYSGSGNSSDRKKDGGNNGKNHFSGKGAEYNANSSPDGDTAGAGGWTREESYGEYTGSGGRAKAKEEMPVWAIVLIVLGCILFSPVILAIACGILSLVVGIFTTLFGLVFGLGIAALVLFVVAVSLVIAGFGCIWAHPLVGTGLIGGGLICASLGILFMIFTVLIAAKCVPAICRGIAGIFGKLSGNKGGAGR